MDESGRKKLLSEWNEIKQTAFWQLLMNRLDGARTDTLKLIMTVKSGDFYERAGRIFELQGQYRAIEIMKDLANKLIKEIAGTTE